MYCCLCRLCTVHAVGMPSGRRGRDRSWRRVISEKRAFPGRQASGIPGGRIPEWILWWCSRAAWDAGARARADGGPAFLEFTTYRFDVHHTFELLGQPAIPGRGGGSAVARPRPHRYPRRHEERALAPRPASVWHTRATSAFVSLGYIGSDSSSGKTRSAVLSSAQFSAPTRSR